MKRQKPLDTSPDCGTVTMGLPCVHLVPVTSDDYPNASEDLLDSFYIPSLWKTFNVSRI
jgi:hypothetical protein